MTNASEFADHNKSYVATFGEKKGLALPPGRKVVIVTCMDARIDPAASLGIKEGDAHVIRNAGGRVSDALRSIIISQQLLGTTEIVVFHHTDCGMLTFQDAVLRDKLKSSLPESNWPTIDHISFLPFKDLAASVKEDVEFLKANPLVLKNSVISGWIYEVETGAVKQVV